MYRLATKEDLPQIIELWQEAFHEIPTLPDCRCFVAELEKKIVGMLFAMEQTLKAKTIHPCVYFYAIATLKAYQGQGICRNLMAYAESHVDADCCMLVPASESLFDFYGKLGYKTVFYRNKTPFSQGTEISMAQYLEKREALLSLPHVVYKELDYAQKIYNLKFYETKDGICAASDSFTAENLPHDLGDAPCGMIKWLRHEEPLDHAYLGFTLE